MYERGQVAKDIPNIYVNVKETIALVRHNNGDISPGYRARGEVKPRVLKDDNEEIKNFDEEYRTRDGLVILPDKKKRIYNQFILGKGNGTKFEGSISVVGLIDEIMDSIIASDGNAYIFCEYNEDKQRFMGKIKIVYKRDESKNPIGQNGSYYVELTVDPLNNNIESIYPCDTNNYERYKNKSSGISINVKPNIDDEPIFIFDKHIKNTVEKSPKTTKYGVVIQDNTRIDDITIENLSNDIIKSFNSGSAYTAADYNVIANKVVGNIKIYYWSKLKNRYYMIEIDSETKELKNLKKINSEEFEQAYDKYEKLKEQIQGYRPVINTKKAKKFVSFKEDCQIVQEQVVEDEVFEDYKKVEEIPLVTDNAPKQEFTTINVMNTNLKMSSSLERHIELIEEMLKECQRSGSDRNAFVVGKVDPKTNKWKGYIKIIYKKREVIKDKVKFNYGSIFIDTKTGTIINVIQHKEKIYTLGKNKANNMKIIIDLNCENPAEMFKLVE